ncbi:MAG: hypothetical protein IPI41_17085 [Flavobacteriales bacterium]|nr:hypothetical protein [Flavobacteriales bacterium]
MKFNAVPAAIAIAISGLIAYAFYSFWGGPEHSGLHLTTVTLAFAFSCFTLLGAIGVELGTSRVTTIVRVLSAVAFLLGVGILALHSMFSDSLPLLIISIGLLSLLYVLLSYDLSRIGQ